jgi:uncharacterized membrane protein YbhN (UPF0104 family)
MEWIASLIIVGMIAFAGWSGGREVILYKKYLKGETQYLVSKRRKKRRLLISFLLVAESALLFCGFFVLKFSQPATALLFWFPPLLLIVLLVYLSVLDFRETSRDIDRIFKEASDTILKKIQDNLPADRRS